RAQCRDNSALLDQGLINFAGHYCDSDRQRVGVRQNPTCDHLKAEQCRGSQGRWAPRQRSGFCCETRRGYPFELRYLLLISSKRRKPVVRNGRKLMPCEPFALLTAEAL